MVKIKNVSEASSSCSPSNDKIYDVFLSFRGEDTRLTFTSHLHKALKDANLKTFLDDEEIVTGLSLKPELESAIRASRASVIVLSKNYASSTWCLNELALILEQHRDFDHIVIPIFYHVEPTDVRNQQNSFGDAMEDYKKKMEVETNAKKKCEWAQKIEIWKNALSQVADLKGIKPKDRAETVFIEEIIKEIYHRLGVNTGGTGNGEDRKITPIKDVNPMNDDISVQGRCISIWHSHKMNAAHDPYNLDLVLQDADNTRIQVYIKKEFMFKFEPLFEEGKCYIISNFSVAENGGKLPLLPHRFKIIFYRTTIVTRTEPFDTNTYGFIFEPYSHLHDPEHHQYYDNDVVDIIGSVIGIEESVPAGKMFRRTVVVEDAESNRLNLTFWDQWASMWDPYSSKRAAIDHLVVILQLGKVKYWDGTVAIHNALFGSKIYINRDIPEIVSFKTRVQQREGFQADQSKITVSSPEVKVQTISEFFHGCVKKIVGSIRECEPDSHCIVLATIHRVQKEHGWAYTACKECNKRVHVEHGRSRKPAFICEDHGYVQAASRFKVIVRLFDESGSAPVVFFNNFYKLIGHTEWELMEKHGMDPDEYWPQELDKIVGKKCLFKIYFSEYNVNYNNHTYRCDGFSENVEFIKHFKKEFLDEDVIDDVPDEVQTQEFATPSTLIKKVTMSDASLSRVLDLQSPTGHSDASGSGSSSGSKKVRAIDLQSTPDTGESSGSAEKKQRVFVDV